MRPARLLFLSLRASALLIIAAAATSLPARAQTQSPPPVSSYLGTGSPPVWAPWTSAAAFGQLPYTPPPAALYCQATAGALWTPCTPSGGGGGSGTVTTVSVATANGFQGTVANPTTTPAISVNVDGTHLLPVNTGSASLFLNQAGGYTSPLGGPSTTGISYWNGSTWGTSYTPAALPNYANINNTNNTNTLPNVFTNYLLNSSVITNGQSWDATCIGIGSSVVWDPYDGVPQYVFYSGGASSSQCVNANDATGREQIGSFTSPDGNTWTASSLNPTLPFNPAGSQPDSGGQSFPQIYRNTSNNLWYAFYTCSASAGFEVGQIKICMATATNLLYDPSNHSNPPVWTRHGAQVTDATVPWVGSGLSVYRPQIVQVGPTYYMWINGMISAGNEAIGYLTATSLDGPWTAHSTYSVCSTATTGCAASGAGTISSSNGALADPYITQYGHQFIMSGWNGNNQWYAVTADDQYPGGWEGLALNTTSPVIRVTNLLLGSSNLLFGTATPGAATINQYSTTAPLTSGACTSTYCTVSGAPSAGSYPSTGLLAEASSGGVATAFVVGRGVDNSTVGQVDIQASTANAASTTDFKVNSTGAALSAGLLTGPTVSATTTVTAGTSLNGQTLAITNPATSGSNIIASLLNPSLASGQNVLELGTALSAHNATFWIWQIGVSGDPNHVSFQTYAGGDPGQLGYSYTDVTGPAIINSGANAGGQRISAGCAGGIALCVNAASTFTVDTSGKVATPNIGISNAITSATGGSGITSVTCATAACTNLRGTYTVVGGTATTGTIITLVWPTTTTAYACSATQNDTGVATAYLGLGHSVATATGMTISAGISVIGTTFNIDYQCQP